MHAFINSKLDFCNSLLYGLPKYDINKLQSVQNAAARVIACLRKFDRNSDTLKELHLLPVEQRIIFQINLLCFKILNNLAPAYLVDLLLCLWTCEGPSLIFITNGVSLLNPRGWGLFQSLPIFFGTMCLLIFDRSMMWINLNLNWGTFFLSEFWVLILPFCDYVRVTCKWF